MHDSSVSRRTMLATLGTGAAAGLAGCSGVLGTGGEGGPNTYLAAKEWRADPDVLPFPTHGDELPQVTLPAGLEDREFTVPDDFAGDDLVMTFVYTHCMSMCPRLTAVLAGVQGHALENGYGEEVSFVETTFDPARDDTERFREWADQHHVAMDAGNWHFLRPEDEGRAKEVVQETYGVHFTKTTPQKMDAYMFAHTGLVLLANRDGYVERAYKMKAAGAADDPVTWDDVKDDLATLREREG